MSSQREFPSGAHARLSPASEDLSFWSQRTLRDGRISEVPIERVFDGRDHETLDVLFRKPDHGIRLGAFQTAARGAVIRIVAGGDGQLVARGQIRGKHPALGVRRKLK